MNQDATKQKSVVTEVVEKSFKEIHEDSGISAQDLFMASLGYAAVGLLIVNLDWMPGSFHALGWSLISVGVLAMVFIRKIL